MPPDHWRWRDGPVDPATAIVFDLDGVLSDAAGRQHFLEQPSQDWEAFFDACGEDPPVAEVAQPVHRNERPSPRASEPPAGRMS